MANEFSLDFSADFSRGSFTPSASGTIVLVGSTDAIIDASGNLWTLPSTQVVGINGTPDTSSHEIVKLIYVSGTVWSLHTSGYWFGKSSPTGGWLPSGGTLTPPTTFAAPPNGTTVLAGSTGVITDTGGSDWTLPSTQVVSINGVPDTGSSGITRIVYVSGTVWSQHTSGYWWGKSSTIGGWSASGSTAHPMQSANNTTVLAGASGVITDEEGNLWTLPSTQVVGINGTPDTTSSGITKIVYLNGTIWSQHTSTYWWGKVSPAAGWTPPGGVASIPTESSSGASVVAGSSGVITDAGGNLWTLPSTQIVNINGSPDTASAGIVKLFYISQRIWSLHTSGYWFSAYLPWTGWSSGTTTTPMTMTTSANGTTVLAGSSGVITDWGANDWTLPSGQVVTINGVADTSSSGIVKLVYVSGTGIVWSLHTSGYWFGKAAPWAGWSSGTMTPPMTMPESSNGTTVLAGASGVITDAGGSDWTLPSTQVVSINGAPDTTSAGITKIVYVSGVVWSQHTSGYWFGKSSPSAGWLPSGGTLTSPI